VGLEHPLDDLRSLREKLGRRYDQREEKLPRRPEVLLLGEQRRWPQGSGTQAASRSLRANIATCSAFSTGTMFDKSDCFRTAET
jgi:hypothetical protein